MSRFYVLCAPGSEEGPAIYGKPSDKHRFGRATWDDSMEMEYHIHRDGTSRVIVRCHRQPLVIVMPSAKAVADFVWTWFLECLVSERVIRLFQDQRLSGFNTRPVTISRFRRRSKDNIGLQRLLELEVYGQGGPPHPDSGSKPLPEVDSLGLRRYSSYKNGLLVDEDTWDGNDFFKIEGWQKIIVTERVKELIESERLSNCLLVPVESMVWPARIPTPEEQLSGEIARDSMRNHFSDTDS